MQGLVLILIIISVKAIIFRQQSLTDFSRKMICWLTTSPEGLEKLSWSLCCRTSAKMRLPLHSPHSPPPTRMCFHFQHQ